MKQIISVYLSKVRKTELASLVLGLIHIAEKYDLVAMGLKSFFDRLVECSLLLPAYTAQNNVEHPLSKTINGLRNQRLMLVKAILRQKSAIEISGISGPLEAGESLFRLISLYLMNFGKLSTKSADSKLSSFMEAYRADEKLSAAAQATGISGYIDELITVHTASLQKCRLRVEDKSGRRTTPLQEQRVSINTSVSNFLKAIEFVQLEHADIDYGPMVAEVNEFLTQYRSLARMRSTLYKQQTDKNETVATSSTTSATAN